MKPLIVMATDSREPSGLGVHMVTLGQALNERFDIILACQNDPAGMAFLERAAFAGLRIKAFDPEQMHLFRSWIQQQDTALLHVHAGIGWEAHDLVRYGKAAGVPVVRTEHLPYLLTSVVQQAGYTAMLTSLDSLISVSDAAFQSVPATVVGSHTVVRNGITPLAASNSPQATRAKLGLGEDDIVLLTVARFTAQKGYSVLVAAATQILQLHPHAKFLLVGIGPEQERINDQIADAGLNDSIVLLGNRDDVADLMAIADVFVLPSFFEGLPLALLEAAAAGVPVVATAIGGTLEAIGPDHPFLVPPGDSVVLAEAILRVLAQPGLAQDAASRAKARFENHFTAQRMADQTAKVYAPLPDPF